jgi:hypothetical protein
VERPGAIFSAAPCEPRLGPTHVLRLESVGHRVSTFYAFIKYRPPALMTM